MRMQLAFSSIVIAVLTTVFAGAVFFAVPYLAQNACIDYDVRGFAVAVGSFKVVVYVICSIGGAFAATSLKKVPEHKYMAYAGLVANLLIVVAVFQWMRLSLA